MVFRMFVLQVLDGLIQTRGEQQVPLREVRILYFFQDVTVQIRRSHSFLDLCGEALDPRSVTFKLHVEQGERVEIRIFLSTPLRCGLNLPSTLFERRRRIRFYHPQSSRLQVSITDRVVRRLLVVGLGFEINETMSERAEQSHWADN